MAVIGDNYIDLPNQSLDSDIVYEPGALLIYPSTDTTVRMAGRSPFNTLYNLQAYGVSYGQTQDAGNTKYITKIKTEPGVIKNIDEIPHWGMLNDYQESKILIYISGGSANGFTVSGTTSFTLDSTTSYEKASGGTLAAPVYHRTSIAQFRGTQNVIIHTTGKFAGTTSAGSRTYIGFFSVNPTFSASGDIPATVGAFLSLDSLAGTVKAYICESTSVTTQVPLKYKTTDLSNTLIDVEVQLINGRANFIVGGERWGQALSMFTTTTNLYAGIFTASWSGSDSWHELSQLVARGV